MTAPDARFVSLSPSAQAAYAQLFDATQAVELTRSVANLHGSFSAKTVKERKYWYFQFTARGRLHQLYVGPDSPQVRELIERRGDARAVEALTPLVRAARVLGCEGVLLPHYRVVARLSDYGFFQAGGVLVGTHAFLTFGNMLGVRWSDASRTLDVDFAHAGKSLEIALPSNIEIDAQAAIDSLKMGFLPLMGFDGKPGASWLSADDPDFQIDFLTTLHRGGNEPYRHARLGILLQPLKFMEYLLEDTQQAALFCNDGAVLVNVPHPARYALHKLIVAGERSASRAAKSNKDLRQSAALLAVYGAVSDWAVREAWQDLLSRGPGWRERAQRGRAALIKLAPDLDVAGLLPSSTPRKK